MPTRLQLLCLTLVVLALGLGVGVATYNQVPVPGNQEANNSSEFSQTLLNSGVLADMQEMLDPLKTEETNISESSRTLPNSVVVVEVHEMLDLPKAGKTNISESFRTLPRLAVVAEVHEALNLLEAGETNISKSSRTLPRSAVVAEVHEMLDLPKAGETNISESFRTLPTSAVAAEVHEALNLLEAGEANISKSSWTLPNSAVVAEVHESLDILKAGETNIYESSQKLPNSAVVAEVHETLDLLKASETNIFPESSPTLPNSAVLAIVDENLAASCESSITLDLVKINDAIQTKYKSLCTESNDINSLRMALASGFNTMQRLAETNFTNLSEFIDKLLNAIQDMNVPVNRAALSRISQRITHSQLDTGFSICETGISNSRKWVNVFLPAKDYIFGLANWYTFLLELYRKLSEYSFQKDTTKYNVNDVRNWGVVSQTQGIHINKNNVNRFLQKLQNLQLAGLKLINASDIEDVILRDLNKILDLTLKSRVQLNEISGNLTIEGQYVVISKLTEALHNPKYNSVNIFALNTVFIDADIERIDKDFQLAIIALNWDVQGNRRIVLNGAPGQGLPKAKQGGVGAPDKAADGEDGKPGNPGFPGGSFFGVGLEFRQGDHLLVSSRGGAGGRGQDGGDGSDGLRQAETNPEKTLSDICPFRYPMPHQYEIISTKRYLLYDYRFLKVFPSGVASEGGNGGSGGVGGKGGHAGIIGIIHLGGESGIRIHALPGPDGIGGRGGEGGKSGYVAKTLIVYMKTGKCGIVCYSKRINQCEGFIDKQIPGHELPRGFQGNDNSITNGRLPPLLVRSLQKSKIINMFKRYSWTNLKHIATFSLLSTFLANLEKSFELRSTYDILSYVEEFRYLDSVKYPTDSNVDLTIYYRYILESLNKYFKSPSQLNADEMRVVTFVYTAALSRICRLRARVDRSLIIDLSLYLKHAKSTLPKLADLKTYQEIDNINANYANTIELKINEANDIIRRHLLVEIDEVVDEIERNIRNLESETKTLQQSARVNADAILEHERQLLGNKVIRIAAANLRLTGTLMLVLIASTKMYAPLIVALGIFNIYINGLLQIENPIPQTYPEGLKDTILGIQLNSEDHLKERKLAKFITLTDIIVGEIDDDYLQLNQLKSQVAEIKSNLTGKVTRSLATARDDLQRAILLAESDLHPDDIRGKEKLDKISSLFYDSDDSLKILAMYQTSSGRKTIGRLKLKAADEKIRELEMYEEQIHEAFVPLLRNMHQSLTSIESNLANQSHVFLDVRRWQVQKCIRNVKHAMQQMTRGFHEGPKLDRTISKLEEVADLIINLYDRIEIYQDQKRFGDFVSAINKLQVRGIPIRDPILKAAMTDLQVVITSNAIITQCSRALNAFKQQVFPFVDSYLHVLHDDLSLESNGNISTLVAQAEDKLHLLIRIVSETKSNIQSIRDSNVITKVFSSNQITRQPFFTWGHDIFKEDINDFLSGKEIVLKAKLGQNTENAVKFSFINLNVRATNEQWQAELDEAIIHFDVQLKHFGNSHYRCGDQFYVISGESQTFTYSYENYNSTTVIPIRSNQVYNKIKAGDISLSPYAMWSLKLESKTSSFKALSRFQGKVDLELAGEGQYVKENAAVCQGSLDQYYDVYQD